MVIRLHYPPTESRPECRAIEAELVPKGINVKNIGLRFAVTLLAILGSLSAAQAQTPPAYVYRFSRLSPAVVFANGFLPPATHPMTGPVLDLGRHLRRGSEPSGYISTTSRHSVALDLAEDEEEGQGPEAGANDTSYWLYTIVPDATFVDVDATIDRTMSELPADSDIRRNLAAAEQWFPNYFEYAAQWQIDPSRIIQAEQYDAETGTYQGTETHDSALAGHPTAAIHPNNVPLGTVRGIYYGYTPAAGSSLAVAVPEGFFCGANGTGPVVSRQQRSTDSTASTGSSDCPDLPETVVATVPLNTPAGFGITTNVSPSVPVGQFRQWVDVDGDGLADMCMLYWTPYVACYRQTASTNKDGEQGIFDTVVLYGALTDTPSHYESFAFVNVTGQPGDIAFCWANSNVNGTRYDIKCDNFPKSNTAKISPVAVEFGAQPSQYYGGGQWVDGLTGNHRPAFCSVAPYLKNFYMLCSVYPGTAPAGPGSAIVPALFTDNGAPGSQFWADVTGNGTKAYCRVDANDHLRCLPFNTNNGVFGIDFESSEELETTYYRPTAAWSADVNGDGKADYCRAIPEANPALESVLCVLSTGSGFSGQVTTPIVAKGYPIPGPWWTSTAMAMPIIAGSPPRPSPQTQPNPPRCPV